MKIAAISEDGTTISQHFGRALLYIVLTVEEGEMVGRESRSKAGHHTFTASGHAEPPPGQRHGYDVGAQARHGSMVAAITDCQVVLAGGMGWGAYESLRERGLEVVVTDVKEIDRAVELYVKGELPNLMERLH